MLHISSSASRGPLSLDPSPSGCHSGASHQHRQRISLLRRGEWGLLPLSGIPLNTRTTHPRSGHSHSALWRHVSLLTNAAMESVQVPQDWINERLNPPELVFLQTGTVATNVQAPPLELRAEPSRSPELATAFNFAPGNSVFFQLADASADVSADVIADGPVAKFQLPPGEEVILDAGRVLTPAKAAKLKADIRNLEETTGWRLRVLTRFAPGAFDTDEIRAYWKPDERTVIVILDETSPNIFNFNAGDRVRTLLPRQFFIELQSRFGNQFYVAQEGDQTALVQTVGTLVTCLSSPEGCVRVPGLSEDLFLLTLGTSAAGGVVFGFALRQERTNQVTETWQWVLIFSPLWFILFVALGLQPIASRTSEAEPLLKDTLVFLAAAAAIYLTPIFGESPASRWFKGGK